MPRACQAHSWAVGSVTCPLKTGVRVGLWTIANANGWSARTATCAGGGADVASTPMPVTAAASVPASVTVMFAR
jgi:hypothetical protein